MCAQRSPTGAYENAFPSLSGGMGAEGFRQFESSLDRIVSGRASTAGKEPETHTNTIYNSRFQFFNNKRNSTINESSANDIATREDSLVKAWKTVSEIDALLGSDFRPSMPTCDEDRPSVDDTYVKRLNTELEAALNVSLTFKERLRDSVRSTSRAAGGGGGGGAGGGGGGSAASSGKSDAGDAAVANLAAAAAVAAGGGRAHAEASPQPASAPTPTGLQPGRTVLLQRHTEMHVHHPPGPSTSASSGLGLPSPIPSPGARSPQRAPSPRLSAAGASPSLSSGVGGVGPSTIGGGIGGGGGGGGVGLGPGVGVGGGVGASLSLSAAAAALAPRSLSGTGLGGGGGGGGAAGLSNANAVATSAVAAVTAALAGTPVTAAADGGRSAQGPSPSSSGRILAVGASSHTPQPPPLGQLLSPRTAQLSAASQASVSASVAMPAATAAAAAAASAAGVGTPAPASTPHAAPAPTATPTSVTSSTATPAPSTPSASAPAAATTPTAAAPAAAPAAAAAPARRLPGLLGGLPMVAVGSALDHGLWDSDGGWRPADPALDVHIPQHLQRISPDDIIKVRELGRGCFGSVWLARWRGVEVAMKELLNQGATDTPPSEVFSEAERLASLRHPCVIAFYGIVTAPGAYATVVEFLRMGSLKSGLTRLRKQGADISKRLRVAIALQAARGMEYLHGQFVVHFDLKCDNLLCDLRDPVRPVVKIGDLGLSKKKKDSFVSGNMRGTLPWMAPELFPGVRERERKQQAEANGHTTELADDRVNEKVDVFSFGIVLWEIWCLGEQPYNSISLADIFAGVMTGTLRPGVPPDCDPDWAALMQACWHGSPRVRPSFTDIADRLDALLAKMTLQEGAAAGGGGSAAGPPGSGAGPGRF
ncbi:hypothetical protein HYH03_014275 [Edaphochlamys debaryana]|uniref:Protein kinase domain-containing protein n=1 Tax=Edaphochlamys debaryana TaxID=47281 RepID=A0A836BTN6_9CHLO|nr:hypothetical protein HYH03_014275 [Edaphochlamys debaryana]|eukprot:KAG2487029.1 hypothetical protein HYH03_014275 [Edaphochlamys debaryana]